MRNILSIVALSMSFVGCDPSELQENYAEASRAAALEESAWSCSEWISVKDAPVFTEKVREGARAADGTSWFVHVRENEKPVKRAVWMTTGLGVYEITVNGKTVGCEVLKPGYTHVKKTRLSFTYDVTKAIDTDMGAKNLFAAEVSSGWWRDKIVNFAGRKSAFRSVLEFEYEDGTKARFGTNCRDWKAGIAGPVTHAAIFDGEECDARLSPGFLDIGKLGVPERNDEFRGEIHPSEGAEVYLRRDLAFAPIRAYCWKGVDGKAEDRFGKVRIVREFAADEVMTVEPGETLVLDFGQNCAAVPAFVFKAVAGTVLTAKPAEMLNDHEGLKSRGNDGPEGSVYRVNLRTGYENGRLVKYAFADSDDFVSYRPRFTFFGYRYLSVEATESVKIAKVSSVPVTSVARELETGKFETGVADLNRFIKNVYWGQLSNYLSVPTDCPQRNERLGWTADAQVFAPAGAYNANTFGFFRKWMRDMRDSQWPEGWFPGVAPFAQYGNDPGRLAWSDAGIIIPYQMWLMFGNRSIIDENWESMVRQIEAVNRDGYGKKYQWADWLSYEKFQSCGGDVFEFDEKGRRIGPKPETLRYWEYLGACYHIFDADMMSEMAKATGRQAEAKRFASMAADVRAQTNKKFFTAPGGTIEPMFADMQTPAVLALKFGLVQGEAKAKTLAGLLKNIKDHGDCLQTGFVGTSFLMEVLSENGANDVACTLLLQHKNPSWLYSVDQGATTVWERWNSYTLEKGFGPVSMNSFNHYAYGAVLAWMYINLAGIAPNAANTGFQTIVMAPKPDRRLGFVKAEYMSAAGLVKSAWRYDGDEWVWSFTVPEGAKALVTLPGESVQKSYTAGSYTLKKVLK